jgi:Mg-chelatase subunit ChlD
MWNYRRILMGLLLGGLALMTAPSAFVQEPAKKKQERPRVEVVFCLDTTGSMGGLIDAAKQKIWSIANQISSGEPTPLVKIGLVAYRDRGDAYITKVIDLTDDLDAIHGHLMGFKAEGGGDTPESVNQALHESVTKISWSTDKKTLRMIFLVGDAPPHMDYPDDVKYPVTCKLALKKDIIINTVQCGNDADCKKYWLEICKSTEGRYVQIDANGGKVVQVATPFDAELAKINVKINKTQLVYGAPMQQMSVNASLQATASLPVTTQADRAAFTARNEAATTYDLAKQIKDGKVKLETLKKDELPEQLKGKLLAQQKEILANIEKERETLSKQAIDLDKKRTAFISKKLAEDAKNRTPDSFDAQVLSILQSQATRANIRYAIEEKKK